MSSRLVGAVLALTAAALLAASIWTSALRAGHPVVAGVNGGRPIDKKTVYIGALRAEGCNTGGDEKCVGVRPERAEADPNDKRLPPLKPAFAVIKLSVLVTHGALMLVLLTLAGLSFAKSEARKAVAKIAILAVIIAGAATIALIAYGDAFMEHVIDVPIGYGSYLFAGALLGTIFATVLAPKVDPPPRPRPSRTPSQPRLPAPPPQPEFNVEALFAAEPVPQRPSHPAYPPPISGTPAPPYAPFGDNGMGPNGPMGHGPNGPMNSNGPMDFGPMGHGPNGPTNPNGPMNPNGPAPIPGTNPRQIGPSPIASPGGMLPGPAGPLGASSAPMFGEQPAFAPRQLPQNARTDGEQSASIPPGPRTKQASVVPPPRTKPASIAPPIPGLPPGPRPKPASLAPPPFKVPTIPPFVAAGSAPGAGFALPGLPPAVTPQPDETTDPEAKVLRPATSSGMGVNETTDMSAMPIADEDAGSSMHTPPVDRDSVSDLAETTARPKMDPEELEATNDIGKVAAAFKAARAASEDGAAEAVTQRRRDGADVHASSPRPDSKPAVDEAEALAKIPVTTASEDLPPPKEEKAAPGPQPACPQCEAPMAWVEEHLRFYCKSCRMYF